MDTPGLITGSLSLSKQVPVTDRTLKPKGKVRVGKSGCFYLKEEKGQVIGSTQQGVEFYRDQPPIFSWKTPGARLSLAASWLALLCCPGHRHHKCRVRPRARNLGRGCQQPPPCDLGKRKAEVLSCSAVANSAAPWTAAH